ncbi:hypothetical protein [Parasynechococcus sp.]|uniref:hypothetical protein n=1 Tax=Parasynechococcus sp. TaxID=3101203 RepID=UPI00370485CC
MLSFPSQQPSPRQNALALQIQEARISGDEALLVGLISQWVHRYGFHGAAELDLSLPEPVASKREFSPTPMPVDEEEIAAEDDVLVDNEVVAEEETIVEKEEIAVEETQLQRSFPAVPVPAPPISTPRSLRRWLPRREDDAFPFPKAS